MTLPAENQQTVEAALDVLRAACEARFPEDHPWQMALDEIRAALRDLVAQAEARREVLRAAEEWAYQRKKWIDGQSVVSPLRDAEANLVHAVHAARLDGAR